MLGEDSFRQQSMITNALVMDIETICAGGRVRMDYEKQKGF